MKKIFLTLLTAVSFFAATAQESKTMYVMKDNAILFEYVVSEIDSIIFYKPSGTTPVIPENGVLINGVVWATRNVDASGTFVDNPEDFGKLYQWDSNVSWTSTDPMISSNGDTEWDMNYLSGTTWEKFNDPSPAGWRVPTHEEHLTLLDTEKVLSEWFILNGVTGRKFTDIATGNSIFLPAVGFRVYGDYGALENAGGGGYYWSSTQNESNGYEAYTLGFNDEEYGAYFYDSGWRLDGFSVRPVSESTVVLPVVTSVSLNRITLNIGEDHTLTATVLPENTTDRTVTWTSSNNSIATVDNNGKVTAIAEGTVTITAKAGNQTATCIVTVIAPNNPDKGVLINGVVWATRNVDAPGTFAANPEDAGMFYQWNRNVGWSSTDPMINSNGDTTWDTTIPEVTEWEAANCPCPPGYRVPTQSELQSLVNSGSTWTTQNGVNGRRFGTAPNTIFLPAAGRRLTSDGTLLTVGSWAHYWSSTPGGSPFAWGLDFGSSLARADWDSGNRRNGFSVRCVSEN
jgi:uncharacterized protein (TIGR02145 family)